MSIAEKKDERLTKNKNGNVILVKKMVNSNLSVFSLKPGEIIKHLNLKYPRYRQTAANGHFGRENELFTWEKTDKADEIQSAVSERK